MRRFTMKGQPVNILGEALTVGQIAPDFEVVSKDMTSVRLSDFAGKVIVLNSIPSIDTPACNRQVVRFNQEAALLFDAVILSVSVDLPFALNRFCGTYGIENVKTTSDYKNLDFGKKYGVIIEDMKILTRAVFVIDKEGIIRYAEYVPEISDEPDFDKALKAIKALEK